ncbi:MAG TPA: hypothetical protein VFZ61_30400, partial [Polyangiales bacterium]
WLATCSRSVQEAWRELQAIDPRTHEHLEPGAVRGLQHQLDRSLAEIVALAAQLMERCDRQLEAEARSGAAATQCGPALLALSDVCFMAMAEANGKRGELSRDSQSTDALQSLYIAASALRRARKILTTIDAQVARALGTTPAIDGSARLHESLEIRKQYSILRRSAEAESTPSASELRRRLRVVEMRIGMLATREIYANLRLDDRIELSALRQRIGHWLELPQDVGQGRRLWEDVVGFTHVLTQVNLRQELRAHDTRVVRGALDLLNQESGGATVNTELWESMRGLLGLHDALDDALRRDDRDWDRCRALLHALAEQLGTSELRP